jgi:hypothetical protein
MDRAPTGSLPTARYRLIARLFRDAAGQACVNAPATLEEVIGARDALGYRFPDSYVWFQLEFGDVADGPLGIYSVRTVDPPRRNIVDLNLDERRRAGSRLPAHLIAFSDNGAGDYFCFDASARRHGECPVVWWSHELDGQEPETAAPSFLDWIENELGDRAVDERPSPRDAPARGRRGWLREWFRRG